MNKTDYGKSGLKKALRKAQIKPFFSPNPQTGPNALAVLEAAGKARVVKRLDILTQLVQIRQEN